MNMQPTLRNPRKPEQLSEMAATMTLDKKLDPILVQDFDLGLELDQDLIIPGPEIISKNDIVRRKGELTSTPVES